MDKIWYRKSFRSRRSLAFVAGMKIRMTTQNRQKNKNCHNYKQTNNAQIESFKTILTPLK